MKRRMLVMWLPVLLLAQTEEKKTESKKAEEKAQEASPSPVEEPVVRGTLEVGYRAMTDVAGSQAGYRSVVNLGEGPKLTVADFDFRDPSGKLFDRANLTATSWGGDPYNTLRLDMQRSQTYRFTGNYRNIAYYNFLPSFANPLLGQGVFLNQRSFDTRRRNIDLALDLLPGGRIVPFFAYTRDSGFGTGITPFQTGGNEYAVSTRLDDHTDHYRGGVRIEGNRWHATLEQGGTQFADNQQVLSDNRSLGNNRTPFFGQTLELDKLRQAYGVTGDSIYTKVLANASPYSWLNLYGLFLYSRPQTDIRYTQTNNGLFVLLGAVRFFNGQTDSLGGMAAQPHTSGSGSAELRLGSRVRIFESLSTDRLHVSSSALLAEQLLFTDKTQDTLSLASADQLVYNYNRHQTDVFFDLTSKITLRGGYRYVWGDAQVRAPSLDAPLALENGKMGTHVALMGANWRPAQKLSINLDGEAGVNDSTYFRTSLADYQRFRGRARYTLTPTVLLTGSVSLLNNDNTSRGTGFSLRNQNVTMGMQYMPAGGKKWSFLGEYTRSSYRSDTTYLSPSDLQRERSLYRDNAHLASAMIDCKALGPVKLSFGGSMFLSAGSRPTRYWQPLGRLQVPLHKRVELFSEWRYYGLSEIYYIYEGFRNHQFLSGLRFTM